ncbi:MAG: hypothetical protein ACI8V4_001517 [Ilumatobacter sp.]|jgi:hypothetical protein
MARSAEQSGGSASAGFKAVGAMVFVVAMALVVLLLVSARPGPEPFDPRSGQPSGARGLVLTLQSAGANVDDTRTVPGIDEVGVQRVLVLEDRLNDQQRTDLLNYVEAGGIVVVADPASSLHGGSGLDGGALEVRSPPSGANRSNVRTESNVTAGACTIGALAELRGVYVPNGVLFPVGPDEPQCLTTELPTTDFTGHSFVIVREIGAGLIIGLGDNEPFINRNLRRADNAGLAVVLLVPERDVNVTFLLGSDATQSVQDVGAGDDTLRDLVPTWVWMSITLSAIAFVLFAVSRSARVGRLVIEPIATPIAGSELVSATGNLMQRAGHSSHAGWLLLEHLHCDLCRTHGIDVAAPIADLDRAVAQRSGILEGDVDAVLRRTVKDAAGLINLTVTIDKLRHQVFGPPDVMPASLTDTNISPTEEKVTTP